MESIAKQAIRTPSYFFMFSFTFAVILPINDDVLVIPRCTAFSTVGMLLLPIFKFELVFDG